MASSFLSSRDGQQRLAGKRRMGRADGNGRHGWTTEHDMCDCPICGRPLKIPQLYQEQLLRCTHCNGTFVAPNARSKSRGK